MTDNAHIFPDNPIEASSPGPIFGQDAPLSAASAAPDYSAGPSPDLAAAAGPAVAPDPFFIPPPELPTQLGPRGVRFDFNDGARVWLPPGKWHVEIHDAESGNVIFACDADEGWVVSTKKYYVPFQIKIWERGNSEPLVDHALNLRDRPVLVKFPVGTLGDLVGWFPYAEKFLRRQGCVLECALGRELIEIFAEQYPEIILNVPQEIVSKEPYASYRV
ncbi:MAG: hypothetical protein LBM00_02580, partial [Deltaproteobacteria bacterium]|nr:hypothetical protein [Deltaproteobacteria bacterium]